MVYIKKNMFTVALLYFCAIIMFGILTSAVVILTSVPDKDSRPVLVEV